MVASQTTAVFYFSDENFTVLLSYLHNVRTTLIYSGCNHHKDHAGVHCNVFAIPSSRNGK